MSATSTKKRRRALLALPVPGSVLPDDLQSALLLDLNSEDLELVATAIDVLGRLVTFRSFAPSEALMTKVELLARHDEAFVRAESCATLAQLPESRDLQRTKRALLDALDDEHPRVREQAAAAIGDLKLSEARGGLKARMEDKDGLVAFEAAFALASLQDPDSAPLLIAALDRKERRLDACEGLRRLGPGGAKAALGALIKLSDRFFLPWADRLTILATRYALGDKSAATKLLERTEAFSREERTYALSLLGSHKIEEGLDRLEQVATDRNSKFRETAVIALGELKHTRSQSILQALMESKDTPVELLDTVKEAYRASSTST